MTKEEFVERANHEQIPIGWYSLEGGMPHDRLCIQKTTAGWEVYYSELGKMFIEQVFESENDAYDYLYKRLKEWMAI